MKKNNLGRHKARRFALQALYQWQMSGSSITDIKTQFLVEKTNTAFDSEYFCDLLTGVTSHQSELDAVITPFMSRTIESLDPIECAVLRLATYELVHCPQIPYKVVINEALELTKTFGTSEGHKFVNGVLDKVAQQVRVVEIKGNSK
jgi:N utilization substance protein B